MKKIFILMLAVVFALSASACRESEKNSDIFIGEWKISGAQIGDQYIDSRLFIELGVNEFESFSLVLEPDGKAIISSEGQQQETDWQENENGVKVGGAKLEYRDEALWIDTEQGNLRLEKAGSSDEEIDGISWINKTASDYIVVLTTSGRVNKFSQLALPLSTRTKRGNKVIKLGKGDRIRLVCTATDDSILSVTGSSSGKLEIPVGEIPMGSSISSGTKLFSTRGNIILDANVTTRV